jgi:hypothetical protein
MRPKAVAIAAAVAVLAFAALAWTVLVEPDSVVRANPPPPEPPVLSSEYPGGKPIDAARISTGKLAFERMPAEVTTALELHSNEIVKTAAELETKQARITGTCAPGSAIRVVGDDGSVVCQKLPRGVVSVAALTAVPRVSSTGTAQGSVPGGVGRYQTEGDDDFLVAAVSIPDGAVVTGFSYTYWDADARADGAAYLYRTDDTVLAGVATQGAANEVRRVSTEVVQEKKVENQTYGYFVYFQTSAVAGPHLMPIAASVTYRLP